MAQDLHLTGLGIPAALAKYYHTIAVDLVGFGESDKPDSVALIVLDQAIQEH